MSSYFIKSFKIDKLWSYRDIDLTFNKDVNILIGPNGSGKTTILNLLHSILSGDLRSISNVNFEQAKVGLRSFKGKSVRTIKVNIADGFLKFKVGRKEHKIHTDIFFPQPSLFYVHGRGDISRKRLSEEIAALVPLIWLPVSRRLPVTEDEEEQHIKKGALESVDLRLGELLDRLSDYHSRLNAQLSERYKKFEHQVLSVILYNKDYDRLDSISLSLPTDAEKEQLQRAFKAAGLLDEQMQIRINDHFNAAEETVKRILEDKSVRLESEDIPVLPLINRTKDMVEYAGQLEKDREQIFAPLQLYEKTVSSFLNSKSVEVDGSGQLKIELFPSPSSSKLDPRLLSSGEKQILILLTQALLRIDEPVVYIADEPELSLHVSWQEKLLGSLMTLGGQKQIIVATHSPDIAGNFQNKVIDLGREG